ncbi:unnamed protein product [Allacma fusca]|uniref:G-protein coupled receptors family 1 profile domain-containing protein n=1 Tax=Allacma fusca TaxID=39272 RepID=A0A8J2JFA1_9HEXA|nr:unnamed protein product [Allacma fusca]
MPVTTRHPMEPRSSQNIRQNEETRQFIYDFIEKHGVDAESDQFLRSGSRTLTQTQFVPQGNPVNHSSGTYAKFNRNRKKRFSTQEDKSKETFSWWKAAICITGLIGNVGVVVHLLQKSPFQSSTFEWIKNKEFCYIGIYAGSIFWEVQAWTLLFLTIERCLSLRRPATSMKTCTSCLVILLIWILASIICLPELILTVYYEDEKFCFTVWTHFKFLVTIRGSFQLVKLLVVGMLCGWIFFTRNCQEEGPEMSLQSTWEAKTGRKLTELTYCIGPIFAGTLPLQTTISKGTHTMNQLCSLMVSGVTLLWLSRRTPPTRLD